MPAVTEAPQPTRSLPQRNQAGKAHQPHPSVTRQAGEPGCLIAQQTTACGQCPGHGANYREQEKGRGQGGPQREPNGFPAAFGSIAVGQLAEPVLRPLQEGAPSGPVDLLQSVGPEAPAVAESLSPHVDDPGRLVETRNPEGPDAVVMEGILRARSLLGRRRSCSRRVEDTAVLWCFHPGMGVDALDFALRSATAAGRRAGAAKMLQKGMACLLGFRC